jgi:alpha-mannosidase
VNSAGQPLDVDVTAVGHAHIDVAWLWTLDQTRRKAGRSFYNALRLMEQFPEFRFTQSQPQLYEYVRQDYPELFAAISQRVEQGDWEPIGGMWVEADCNLTGSESLARQFLLGRRYFRKHFGDGAESPVLWLPDVFGYAWNLPQLIREAGLAYFFTIKIGWSQYNRLPFDSFWWQGLDGSRVLTHFSPTKDPGSVFASTYNAAATPGHIFSTWTNFQQKDAGKPGQTPPLLMSYGYGDGGGGPTREMQENLRQLSSFPAAPRVQRGKVIEFFRELEDSVGDQLPIWNGELYLEYHRGTYTTQSRNKRANRKSEFLLHDAEFLATVAVTMDDSYRYPRDLLQRAWELVCLNQFHDILPGSSIGAVYEESQQQYAEVARLGQLVRAGALEHISEVIGANLLAINPTAFAHREPLFVPGESQRAGYAGKKVQRVSGGYLLDAGELPPYSITPLAALTPANDVTPGPVRATKNLLENDLLRVEFASNGDIERIFDKRCNRDILPAGQIANQFQAYEDRPRTPDAWEIDIYYDDRVWFAEAAHVVELLEDGPLRGTLEIRRRLFNSEIIQQISLVHNSARIDFKTQVDWQERHVLLKVAFPVDVLSTVATYEIQWGNVERPTHRNTSWDWARFETCAQKWVDLSEGDYGVSLLNDCKYGHDIWDNVIRLTLLRGPTDPDPEADLGLHTFTYSLLPHIGPWGMQTLSEAYALNDPSFVFAGKDRPLSISAKDHWAGVPLVTVDKPHIVIETVKLAEDEMGIIVRLYESRRRRGRFILKSAFPLAGAWRTNLLEEDQEPLTIVGHELHAAIKPYQIMSLRLLPK